MKTNKAKSKTKRKTTRRKTKAGVDDTSELMMTLPSHPLVRRRAIFVFRSVFGRRPPTPAAPSAPCGSAGRPRDAAPNLAAGPVPSNRRAASPVLRGLCSAPCVPSVASRTFSCRKVRCAAGCLSRVRLRLRFPPCDSNRVLGLWRCVFRPVFNTSLGLNCSTRVLFELFNASLV